MSWSARLARRRGYFVLALAVFVADQATKVWAHAHLAGRRPLEVVPGLFNLAYSRNPGGLFGYLGDLADPWRSLLLTLVPVLAVGLIASFLLRDERIDRATLTGLGSILGGAVGNLTDRVVRGEVVDFLDVYAPAGRFADWCESTFGTTHWPTFNVADSAIVVGAGLLLLGLFRPEPRRRDEDAPCSPS